MSLYSHCDNDDCPCKIDKEKEPNKCDMCGYTQPPEEVEFYSDPNFVCIWNVVRVCMGCWKVALHTLLKMIISTNKSTYNRELDREIAEVERTTGFIFKRDKQG